MMPVIHIRQYAGSPCRSEKFRNIPCILSILAQKHSDRLQDAHMILNSPVLCAPFIYMPAWLTAKMKNFLYPKSKSQNDT
jgi:hypothetical protein